MMQPREQYMPKICTGCKKDRSAEKLHICHPEKYVKKPHDCAVDGHRGKPGLITMFSCQYCDYTAPLDDALIPSEIELAAQSGVTGNYEDDGY